MRVGKGSWATRGQNSASDGGAEDLSKFCEKFRPEAQSPIDRTSTGRFKPTYISAKLGKFVQGD